MAVLATWLVSAAALGACSLFGPAEQRELNNTAAEILQCQNEGRACAADGGADAGCYAACMKDAGLK